jgi:hypothetical protein
MPLSLGGGCPCRVESDAIQMNRDSDEGRAAFGSAATKTPTTPIRLGGSRSIQLSYRGWVRDSVVPDRDPVDGSGRTLLRNRTRCQAQCPDAREWPRRKYRLRAAVPVRCKPRFDYPPSPPSVSGRPRPSVGGGGGGGVASAFSASDSGDSCASAQTLVCSTSLRICGRSGVAPSGRP